MPPLRPAFEVETFEFVEAGPRLALVRLAGTWRAGHPPTVELFVVAPDGDAVSLSALPAPAAADGLWRAAFSADPALLRDPDFTFELEAPAGDPIDLPRPVDRTELARPVEPEPVEAGPAEAPAPVGPARGPVEPSAEAAPDTSAAAGGLFSRRPDKRTALRRALTAERSARDAAERAAAEERERAERAEASLREELRTTVAHVAELLERIEGYEQSRMSFAPELEAVRQTHSELLDAIRDEADATRAELEAVRRELDAAHEELETVHEAHTLELGGARRERDNAIERRHSLETDLAVARGETETLQAQLAEREKLIERARTQAAAASEESAGMQSSAEHLRDAIAARARDAAASPGRRRGARDAAELERLRDELRTGLDRLMAVELQAQALRDAIEAELPASARPGPPQEALPLLDADGGDKPELDAPALGARPSS